MIKLLVYRANVAALSETGFGGLPVKNIGQEFEWPHCTSCNGPMQFLGKLATKKGLEQLFMCQNDPGLCEEWDPDEGGNKVIVTMPENLEIVIKPGGGDTTRNIEYGSTVVEVDSSSYTDALTHWIAENDVEPCEVLGQIDGEPEWLQEDECPCCDVCKKPMKFVAQLEQGPDWETEMNFGGGGSAYIFDCSCPDSAKFLFQC